MNTESLWLALTALGSDLSFIVLLALYGWLVHPGGLRSLGVAFALSYLVNSALKYGLNLPRPFTADSGVAGAAAQATAGGPGFPSGHAQLSATLWLGAAAQLRRPWVWAACLIVVLLIAASRLALRVHYPSDVLGGLLLGALFAALAASGERPRLLAANWWLPVGLLVVAFLLPGRLPDEYSRGLGLLAGFWAAVPRYSPPSTWTGRVGVAVIGLAVLLAVYLALGALSGLLPDALGNPARALRYFVLVLVAVQGIPALLKPWLKPQASALP